MTLIGGSPHFPAAAAEVAPDRRPRAGTAATKTEPIKMATANTDADSFGRVMCVPFAQMCSAAHARARRLYRGAGLRRESVEQDRGVPRGNAVEYAGDRRSIRHRINRIGVRARHRRDAKHQPRLT